jgi:hypothetical protein
MKEGIEGLTNRVVGYTTVAVESPRLRSGVTSTAADSPAIDREIQATDPVPISLVKLAQL